MKGVSTRQIMPPQSWRRRDFRFPAVRAKVNGGAVEGLLLNVAQTGLAIETDVPVRIGSGYRLSVEFEDAGFSASGTARWCVLKNTRRNGRGEYVPVYHAGFSLEERDEAGQERVLARLRRRLLTPPPS
ncbi:MAG: PilZ domain-containing protein [Deltaproteobacteria bacterium]|nr:PilZ domain-containing protein [Deltaproteobacteria bacterium]